jgi:tRNA C32,U32 (ribose-2'-O)-methylase TrmJ
MWLSLATLVVVIAYTVYVFVSEARDRRRRDALQERRRAAIEERAKVYAELEETLKRVDRMLAEARLKTEDER